MKLLYIFSILCLVFIANYDICKSDEVSDMDRKLAKLRKIKGLVEKQGDVKEKTKNIDKLSIIERTDEKTSYDSTVSDSQWAQQWYLHKDHTPSMGVFEVWEMGYTGKGVVVGLIEDWVDINHFDLVDNFNSSLSYDFIADSHDVSYGLPMNDHGTRTAGIIAASNNDQCVIGIAYDVSFAVLRAVTMKDGATEAWLTKAWMYKLNEIDIQSHGFGIGVDHGSGFYPLGELSRKVLEKSVKEGRHGRGSIHIFASGNDGEVYDDCNTVEYVNSIYTIGVTALAPDGGPASYAEECTCVLVGAFGGEEYSNGTKKYLVTTYLNNTCSGIYGGGSAASSVATGVIALVLQANPKLTWRDMQHLLVETSISANIPRGNFYTNAVGKNVSYGLGFGMINAKGLVERAVTWKEVPSKIPCHSGKIQVEKCCARNVSSSYNVDNCNIQYVEHVQVYISFEVYWREHTEIHLVSPQGTDTRILRQRKQDYSTGRVTYTFMSVHTWGENPTGNWTVRLQDFLDCDNEMNLYSWELILHGTVTSPSDGKPKDGILGGHCDDVILCDDGTSCLHSFNICVNCTIAGHRIVKNSCVKDGYGYCDVNITCQVENAWCNNDNTCETCSEGYHEIDGLCKQDGTLGGYCDALAECTDAGAWCDPNSDRCYLCSDGSHILDGLCIKDGEAYGYCDARIPCNNADTPYLSCDPARNRCINCNLFPQNRILDGFCRKDGTIDGYCSPEISCTESGSSCDQGTSTCISCTIDGYHSVDGYCMQDGVIGGYCDTSVKCTDSGTGCGSESQVCINCSASGYRVLPSGYCRQDGMIGGYCDKNITCMTFSAACDADTSVCETCYAGHSIINGQCYKDELLEADIDWDIETIAGTSVAGIFIGVVINIIIFVFTIQRSSLAKIEFATKQT